MLYSISAVLPASSGMHSTIISRPRFDRQATMRAAASTRRTGIFASSVSMVATAAVLRGDNHGLAPIIYFSRSKRKPLQAQTSMRCSRMYLSAWMHSRTRPRPDVLEAKPMSSTLTERKMNLQVGKQMSSDELKSNKSIMSAKKNMFWIRTLDPDILPKFNEGFLVKDTSVIKFS